MKCTSSTFQGKRKIMTATVNANNLIFELSKLGSNIKIVYEP